MTGKKISIIVPAYNVEGYIGRCMDSLVHQTYENIEIIVIDDGSTDGTPEILKDYKRRYPQKVCVITKENEGQAQARNDGLKQATGDYIGFVDSDDFVDARMYEWMYREAEEKGCDLVTCGYYGCDDETGEITVYQTGYQGEFDKNIYENPLILKVNSPYPWNKLYTRELLQRSGFYFRKGMIFEDLAAVFPLFLDAKKVGRVHEKLYYYIKNRKGGTISTYNEKHGQIIDALEIMNEAYEKRGKFQVFYDILLFFNIRHIHARFDEMERYDNKEFQQTFEKRAYGLLDKWFPGWRESETWKQFSQKSSRVEEGEENPIEQEDEILQISDKVQKKPEKKGRRRAEVFEDLVASLPIQKQQVLIECFHGNNVQGAGYYLAKLLAKTNRYQVYISAADADKKEQFEEMLDFPCCVVDMNDEKYLEVLAQAEYVVNNRAFAGFYRKRKGQYYLFTDFLPSTSAQGYDVTYGTKNIQGIQFSLAQADAILFPEELKTYFLPLLKQFGMEKIAEDKGLFVPVSKFYFGTDVEKPQEKRVAYMPSLRNYPGLKDSKQYLFLSALRKRLLELDEQLEDDVKLYVAYPRTMGRRLKDGEWKHIAWFPEDKEPYEFLATCQGVIGEFGEEIYGAKAMGKSVCQLVEYAGDKRWTEGVASVDESIEKVCDGKEMAQWICGCKDNGDVFEPLQDVDSYVTRWMKQIRKKKNKVIGKQVVYVPRFSSYEEFETFMKNHDVRASLFFVEKDFLDVRLATWLRDRKGVQYMVILRSLVIGKKESRMMKYHLTTKDKLREKRDRQRYLGSR